MYQVLLKRVLLITQSIMRMIIPCGATISSQSQENLAVSVRLDSVEIPPTMVAYQDIVGHRASIEDGTLLHNGEIFHELYRAG